MNDFSPLFDTAWGLIEMGDHTQALGIYQEIARQLGPLDTGSSAPELIAQLARATFGCGIASLNLQLFPQSEAALVEAEQLFRKIGADQSSSILMREYIRTLLNLGILYDLLQRHKQAIDTYQQAVELYELMHESGGGDSRTLANLAFAFGKIAGLLLQMRRFSEACAFNARSEHVYLQLGADQLDSEQVVEYAQTLMIRGLLLSETAQWEEAEHYLSSASDCYQRLGYDTSHPHLMNCLNYGLLQNRGSWLLKSENFTEARESLFQALQIARSLFVERDLASTEALTTVLLKYGIAEHELKSLEKALAAFVEAEQILCDALLSDTSTVSARLMALVLRSRGNVHDDAGQKSDALDCYTRAEQFFRQLGADQPDSPDRVLVDAFAELLRRQASLLARERDQLDQAGTIYGEAERLYLGFGAGGNLPFSHMENWAKVRQAWGKSLTNHQRWDEAIEKYRQAEHLIGDLMTDPPEASLLSILASLLGKRGEAHDDRLQWKEADQAYTNAENLYRQLGAEKPDSPDMASLARLVKLHARVLEKSQEWDRTEAMYDEAAKLYQQLIIRFPGSEYQSRYADVLSKKGGLMCALRRWTDAQQAYDQALDYYRQLGAASPNSSLMSGYADTLTSTGRMWRSLGQWDQARLYYQEAENLLRHRLKGDDTQFQLWSDMVGLLTDIADLYVLLQKPNLALKYCEEADEIRQNLDENGQLGTLNIYGFMTLLHSLGTVYMSLQRWSEALKIWHSALDQFRQAIVHLSEPSGLVKFLLGALHSNMGLTYLQLHQFLDAEQHLLQAKVFLIELGAEQRDSPWLPDLAKLMLNLGLLYTRLEQYQKAKDAFEDGDYYFYCRLHAHEPGSLYSQDYALLLQNQGQMLISSSRWSADPAKDYAKAQEALEKAAELYRALNESSPDRPFDIHLALALKDLVRLPVSSEQYGIVDEFVREAEQILRGKETSEAGIFPSLILAEVLQLRAEALYRQQRLPDALELLWQADQLCRQLGAHEPGSPFMKLLANGIYNRAIIHQEQQEWTELQACVEEWFQCLHQCSHFVSDLIEDLGRISYNCIIPLIKYHANEGQGHYFQRMAELIYKNQQYYLNLQDDRLILKAFWSLWIELALGSQQPFLLTDIVCASQARRHLSLLELALQREKETNERVLAFLDEKHRLDQMQLKLASLSQSLRAHPENRSVGWDIEDLQEQFEAARRQLNELRKELIEVGLYPELNALRLDIDTLQGNLLDEGQAVLVCLCLREYPEIQRKEGILLLVKKSRLVMLDSPGLEASAEAMNQLTQMLVRQGRSFNLRHTVTEPDTDESGHTRFQPNGEPRNFLDDLAGHMTVLWRQLLESGELKDVKQLAIIGHGQASSLPWQGHIPAEISDLKVWQFSGLHALLNRWERLSHTPYPTADNPIALLACPATEERTLHLYHLEAETRLIERIWGHERVHRIASPDDIPESCLLVLLGHGDCRDGRASFHLESDRVLEPQDLLNPRHRLQAVGASACLLGKSEDVDGEPMGLFSLIACRRDVQFSYGALTPIDDFLATCLSLLFHLAWRDSEDPHAAMGLALKQLGEGRWPAEAVGLFEEIYTEYLPELFGKMREDEEYYKRVASYDLSDSYKDRMRKEVALVIKRNAFIRETWCMARFEDQVKALSVLMDTSDQQQEDKKQASKLLVKSMMQHLNRAGLSPSFRRRIKSFIPYWIWG